ncbi:hypothetical protein [[Kitasatospora] papulosa]|uniref:hypothetical protein n=1 Tax=[Kitasatospora] papulosa TaxID=1464011 RepID=UPI0036952AD2
MSAYENAVQSLINGGYPDRQAREILSFVCGEAQNEGYRRGAAAARDELAAQVAAHGPFPMPVGDTARRPRQFTPLEEAVRNIETAIAPLKGDQRAGADMVLTYLRTLTTPVPAVRVSPWERAVAGLNALVDANIAFWIEPDGHISGPFGDEHIEWDHDTSRWRLVHDDEDAPTPPASPEDPHDSPLHRAYETSHDLPEVVPQCTSPNSPSCSCASGEYRFCGASLGRDEYPFTCNRRVAHQGPCSGELDPEATS